MMRALVMALGLVLMAGSAWAEGPINPSEGWTVTLPQLNVDGSMLLDLSKIGVCVGVVATGLPFSNCQTVPVTTPDPPAAATLLVPITAFPGLADGQYYSEAFAEDIAGNRSAPSTPRVAFVVDRTAPASPTLTVK